MSDEYNAILHEILPTMGENCWIMAPLSGTRFNKVKIGNKVMINAGCLMMAAGGITIDDEAQIAASIFSSEFFLIDDLVCNLKVYNDMDKKRQRRQIPA